MQGYDREEAAAFMLGRLRKGDHPALDGRAEELIRACIEADLAYMEEAGVADGAFYDDQEAYDSIVRAVFGKRATKEEKDFVDTFTDLQQAYLEEKGMVEWE